MQAASPLLRNVGTVGGNLCQHTRCWYYRARVALLARRRRHLLRPDRRPPQAQPSAGDCISAHPSDLAPALAACGATSSSSAEVARAPAARSLPAADRGQPLAADLAPGELVTRCGSLRRRTPPSTSARRARRPSRSRSSRSPPPAAGRARLVAAGMANFARLDAADPLRGCRAIRSPAGSAVARDARRARARRRGLAGSLRDA